MRIAPASNRVPPRSDSNASACETRNVLVYSPAGADTELSDGIAQLGYRTAVFESWHDLEAVAARQAPYAVICLGIPSGASAPRHYGQRNSPSPPEIVPFVVVCEDGDFATRLRAVRCGAHEFLTAPVEALALVDRVEQIRKSFFGASGYRVLLVDDDDIVRRQKSWNR